MISAKDDDYVGWIMTEGVKLIKASHPDADDFRYIRRKSLQTVS